MTLRVGVVGVGTMGADHAERVALRISNADLVAVSDPDTVRAKELASRFDDVRVIEEPLDLIADPVVDAVILASPGFAHEEQLLACFAHDTPVLCEKPLTMDEDSALRVIAAERAAPRPLVQVGFMRRFDPEYAQLKELLDSGSLGRTLVLHNVHRNKAAPNPDFRSEMIVRDSLVHEVDVARWLFGEEIVEIAVHRPIASSLAPEGVQDPQVAVFHMAGGAVVTNEVFVNSQLGYEVRCETVAERGTATVGLGSGVVTRASGRSGVDIPDDYRVRFARAYDLEVQAWVDACRSGELVGPTAWDGYASTVVCSAGMTSLREGRPVRVSLAESP